MTLRAVKLKFRHYLLTLFLSDGLRELRKQMYYLVSVLAHGHPSHARARALQELSAHRHVFVFVSICVCACVEHAHTHILGQMHIHGLTLNGGN